MTPMKQYYETLAATIIKNLEKRRMKAIILTPQKRP